MTTGPGTGDPWYVEDRSLAWGLSAFAGVTLAMLSAMGLFQGIAAVTEAGVFEDPDSYSYALDLSTWGWLHVVVGAGGLLVGVGIIARRRWAQVGGIAVAVLAAVANFLFLPYYPVWSLTLLAFNVVVIWALTHELPRSPVPGEHPAGPGS